MKQEAIPLQVLTENEMRYLEERSLARIAFVSSDQQVHIMPVLYTFDGSYIYLSGWNLKYSERFRDASSNKVTILVDDIHSSAEWVPRGIEIEGRGETVEKRDYLYIRIKPTGKTSWGL